MLTDGAGNNTEQLQAIRASDSKTSLAATASTKGTASICTAPWLYCHAGLHARVYNQSGVQLMWYRGLVLGAGTVLQSCKGGGTKEGEVGGC